MKAGRGRAGWLLWIHAVLWCLFALAMTGVAAMSPDALADPVFLQVVLASIVAAAGSIAAARFRLWGVILALAGGCWLLAAWIIGDSGEPYRYVVGGLLAAFLIVVAAERRAFVRRPAQ